MLALYGGGAVACLLTLRARRLSLELGHLGTLGGAVVGAVLAVRVLLGAAPVHVDLPAFFPFVRLSLAVDGLSAFFLLVISLVAAAAAIYGPAYLGEHLASGPPVERRSRRSR